ncbi:hypothetical protein [Devosia sp. MC521]|uniref:hypothetical protein n=1 Tax=Devosia sp. MC521 TaxID=2759954 RepID=UPI0015FA0478|nr:hypothetical protein [Devosia sp. MC521]MBJ6989240.1 hypothetical protein [Devosia sp. MC521]QMW63331.1 hypothetical protein H4N61_03050 [Devosia sp. MC521]
MELFIERALDFGFNQMQRSSKGGHNLCVAHKTSRFSESRPLLADAARYCLDEAETEEHPFAQVFAEYSDWHIGSGFLDISRDLAGLAPPALIDHLQLRGWRAKFDFENGRCDIFDIRNRFGVRFLPSCSAQTAWEPTAPLSSFCNWIGEAQGLTMVHAASVAYGDKGALLVGNGGAGKSGTTLACLLNGLNSAGDDYTFVAPNSAAATYRTVKQGLGGLDRLGIKPVGAPNWQNKYVFRPEEVGATAITRQVPINAIFMPKIGADRTVVTPIPAAEPFKILTFSTLKQLDSGYKLLFAACGPLVRALPCYAIHLSADPVEIAETLKRTLESL